MPIFLPKKCLNCRKDCKPLAQLSSDCEKSFICVGENDGSTRTVKQDKYRMCWHNQETDELHDYDIRDLTDTASVICQALSIIQNLKS
jgi:hypothetical protein